MQNEHQQQQAATINEQDFIRTLSMFNPDERAALLATLIEPVSTQATAIAEILEAAAWDAFGMLEGSMADDATLDRLAGQFRAELGKTRELLRSTEAEMAA